MQVQFYDLPIDFYFEDKLIPLSNFLIWSTISTWTISCPTHISSKFQPPRLHLKVNPVFIDIPNILSSLISLFHLSIFLHIQNLLLEETILENISMQNLTTYPIPIPQAHLLRTGKSKRKYLIYLLHFVCGPTENNN